ncbi:glycine zipper 2TM domain-containing protein [Solimonas soli]|uniref:glycine zipper 2TM domain-containing protein n=1 Tax=Solimonas soli TaxID=413479 RepID=UPI0004BA4425|nr:glycine zipper 2TM domain-containing protein [Solimonas soli]
MNKTGIHRRAAAALLAAGGMLASGLAHAEVYTNDKGQRVECHDEQVVTKKGDHPIAAPVIGAIAGGAVGHQFGGGKGQDLATGAGAVGGAVAGKKYNDNNAQEQVTTRRVCTPVE